MTFGSPGDAQDAIDNMDMNELGGKVLKVNLARPMKGQLQAGGNRAGTSICNSWAALINSRRTLVWESEEWLKQYAKPLSQSGGVQGRGAGQDAKQAEDAGEDAMEE